jgi:sialic acid synthase SpsE
MTASPQLVIGKRTIGPDHPTYFVADIAANHDGSLERAIGLIELAAAAGADAVKFQHFKAETIVSDFGFKALGGQQSHQAKWSKSVFEVYRDASVDIGWTEALKAACDRVGITFFTSPYAIDLVDAVDAHVPAYKIGSGDITWIEIIEHIARKQKPYMLATGASTLEDVQRAVNAAVAINSQLALLQCNTNYTASLDNFRFVQLGVLRTYREMYPDLVLGLSDHTPGHATVLGAVALGGRIIEKHFTDDTSRTGPDHAFSMDPTTWREMVDRTLELEYALGGDVKRVEGNEMETVVLQRRSIRASRDIAAGERLSRADLAVLRPAPNEGLPPHRLPDVVGRQARRPIKSGDVVRWTDLE